MRRERSTRERPAVRHRCPERVDERGHARQHVDLRRRIVLACASAIPTARSPASHTYTIAYTVDGAPLPFADHDELYWDVIGHEWPCPDRSRERRPCTRRPTSPKRRVLRRTPPQLAPCAEATASGRNATFGAGDLGRGSGITTVVGAPEGRDPARRPHRSSTSAGRSATRSPSRPHRSARRRARGARRRRRLRPRRRRGRDRRYRAPRSTRRSATSPATKTRPARAAGRGDRSSSCRPTRSGPARSARSSTSRRTSSTSPRRSSTSRCAAIFASPRSSRGAANADYELVRPTAARGELLAVRAAAARRAVRDRPGREALRPQVQVPRRPRGCRTRCTTTPSPTAGSACARTARAMWWRLHRLRRRDRSASGSRSSSPRSRRSGSIPLAIVAHRPRAARGRRRPCPRAPARARRCSRASRASAGCSTKARKTHAPRFAEQQDIFSRVPAVRDRVRLHRRSGRRRSRGSSAEQLGRRAGTHGNVNTFNAFVLAAAIDDFGTTRDRHAVREPAVVVERSGFSGGGFSGGGGGGGGGGSW